MAVSSRIFFFSEIAEDPADVLVYRHQPGVVIFHDAFMRSAGNVRRSGADLVFCIDKTFWLSRDILSGHRRKLAGFGMTGFRGRDRNDAAPGRNGSCGATNQTSRQKGLSPRSSSSHASARSTVRSSG